jgi:hypothetical protein
VKGTWEAIKHGEMVVLLWCCCDERDGERGVCQGLRMFKALMEQYKEGGRSHEDI